MNIGSIIRPQKEFYDKKIEESDCNIKERYGKGIINMISDQLIPEIDGEQVEVIMTASQIYNRLNKKQLEKYIKERAKDAESKISI